VASDPINPNASPRRQNLADGLHHGILLHWFDVKKYEKT
jgi:hypothetical protein